MACLLVAPRDANRAALGGLHPLRRGHLERLQHRAVAVSALALVLGLLVGGCGVVGKRVRGALRAREGAPTGQL
jgi:hypothetical protein